MPRKKPTLINFDLVRPDNKPSKLEDANQRFNDFYKISINSENPKKIIFSETEEVIDWEKSYEEKDFSKKRELTLLDEVETLLPENQASDIIEANLELAAKNKHQSYSLREETTEEPVIFF